MKRSENPANRNNSTSDPPPPKTCRILKPKTPLTSILLQYGQRPSEAETNDSNAASRSPCIPEGPLDSAEQIQDLSDAEHGLPVSGNESDRSQNSERDSPMFVDLVEDSVPVRHRKVPNITLQKRLKAVKMIQSSFTAKEAAEVCGMSVSSVRRAYNRWNLYRRINRDPQANRVPLPEVVVVRRLVDVNEGAITRKRLKKCLQKVYRRKFSIRQITTRLRQAGLRSRKIRRVQHIRARNRVLRMRYKTWVRDSQNMFVDACFIDEVNVYTENKLDRVYTPKNGPRRTRPRLKHPYGLHLLGGCTMNGVTPLMIWKSSRQGKKSAGYFDSNMFANTVIPGVLAPFNKDVMHNNMMLYMDNHPAHTARISKEAITRYGIRTAVFPPESPDYNPIELIWRDLKQHLANYQTSSINTLIRKIKQFWTNITVEDCRQKIRYTREVILRSQDGRNGETGNYRLYRT